MEKIIKFTIENTTKTREVEETYSELYSHDRNNGLFEFEIANEQLAGKNLIALFKFVKTGSYWKTEAVVEDNKAKIKFDTSLITQNEKVICFIYVNEEIRDADIFRFKFNVRVSEIDKAKQLPLKERFYAHGLIVDRVDVLTKENFDNAIKEIEKGSKFLTEAQANEKYALKDDIPTTVDTTDLVTKEQLRKAFLDDEEHEKYAKKTELPQPYNDTDITNRLTALENKPSGNVDTSEFVTKLDLQKESTRINTLEYNASTTITKFETPFKTTELTSVEDYLNNTLEHTRHENYGRLYSDKLGNHLVVTGSRKTAKFETLLYTVGSSLPDSYEPDFEFSESDNLKFITTQNIHNYIPANTGNTGNTTELDKRLKVLEAKQWEIHGRGLPNGVVTAPVGTTYVDEAVTNGALKWIKKSGTGNTGWEVLIGDTGWKILPSVSKLGNSFVKIRRVNNVVSYQFGGLSWGWFGIVRRGGAGYVLQGSDRERNCYIIQNGGIPIGYRAEASLIGNIYNDKGVSYGTWYLGGNGDYNQLRFQFTDPVPTDRDIGDIRISSISYLTSDPWPAN